MPRADRSARHALCVAALTAELLEQDREQRVEHDHEEDRLDHGARRLAPDAFRRAAHAQPVHAADDGDDEREHGRLEQPDEEIALVDRVPHMDQVLRGCTPSSELADDRAAGEPIMSA